MRVCHARLEKKKYGARDETGKAPSALKLLVYSYSQGELTFLALTRCARRSMSRISERDGF